MAFNKQTFITRSLSAVVFVVVLLSSVYFNFYIAWLFFSIIACICFHEFAKLSQNLGVTIFKKITYSFGAIGLLIPLLAKGVVYLHLLPLASLLLILSPLSIAIVALFSKNEKPIHAACFSVLGLFYCFIPFSTLLYIPVLNEGLLDNWAYNPMSILGIIFLIWTNDTFAYLGGSFIGKTKMYERVSPGKTWEGTLVGMACCIGVGFSLNTFGTYAQTFVWPCIAAIVAVFGTIGDLIESLLKRQAGVKDSGQLMPGHGGALDRFDSLIAVAPLVFTFLAILKSMGYLNAAI